MEMTPRQQNGNAFGVFPLDRLDRSRTTGLIVAGMGGPDSPGAVEPFLRNLFRDPAVLPMPRLVARLLGSFIVRRRLKKVKERYAQIGHGGGSPQLEQTREQCALLSRFLAKKGITAPAAPAMRYWHPFPEECVETLIRKGAGQFAIVPAYPQYAGATSGSVLNAVVAALRNQAPEARVFTLMDWHLLPGYLDALVRRAEPVLRGWAQAGHDPGRCAVLFAAHSLPERFLKSGDPYVRQTCATVKAVHDRLEAILSDRLAWWEALPGGGAGPLVAYQSKVGPVRWVGPELVDEVCRLAESGCRCLLLVPVSFTCEHIETLHELDIELAAKAGEAGIEEYVRTEALNLDAGWLESLAEQIEESAFEKPQSSGSGNRVGGDDV